jgi:DNA-directed RNA polymerase specialized sigma24 family protein
MGPLPLELAPDALLAGFDLMFRGAGVRRSLIAALQEVTRSGVRVVITGLPGTGKSTLAGAIAYHIAACGLRVSQPARGALRAHTRVGDPDVLVLDWNAADVDVVAQVPRHVRIVLTTVAPVAFGPHVIALPAMPVFTRDDWAARVHDVLLRRARMLPAPSRDECVQETMLRLWARCRHCAHDDEWPMDWGAYARTTLVRVWRERHRREVRFPLMEFQSEPEDRRDGAASWLLSRPLIADLESRLERTRDKVVLAAILDGAGTIKEVARRVGRAPVRVRAAIAAIAREARSYLRDDETFGIRLRGSMPAATSVRGSRGAV